MYANWYFFHHFINYFTLYASKHSLGLCSFRNNFPIRNENSHSTVISDEAKRRRENGKNMLKECFANRAHTEIIMKLVFWNGQWPNSDIDILISTLFCALVWSICYSAQSKSISDVSTYITFSMTWFVCAWTFLIYVQLEQTRKKKLMKIEKKQKWIGHFRLPCA